MSKPASVKSCVTSRSPRRPLFLRPLPSSGSEVIAGVQLRVEVGGTLSVGTQGLAVVPVHPVLAVVLALLDESAQHSQGGALLHPRSGLVEDRAQRRLGVAVCA